MIDSEKMEGITMKISIVKQIWLGFVIVLSTINPVSAITLTVGKSSADYTTLDAALVAVAAGDTTVQFIDSETYDESTQLDLSDAKYEGLTLESATGERATVNYTGTHGYGLLFGQTSMTLRNLNMQTATRTALFLGGDDATGMVVSNVNFMTTLEGDKTYLLGAAPNMTVSYCTFYGNDPSSLGGRGISVYMSTGSPITIEHCSFDNLGVSPIHNGTGGAMTVRDCAFGAYRSSTTYRKGIYVADTLTEDYNAWYLQSTLAWPEGGTDWTGITNGGHSVKVATYGDIFTGNTSTGDWTVADALLEGASDGTTIGAWQWPGPSVLTVGVAGMYPNFDSAMATPPGYHDIIRFIDSETYVTTNAFYLSVEQLTIDTIEGEQATLYFTNTTGSAGQYYGLILDEDNITISNLNITAERSTIIAVGSGSNATFRSVNFVNSGGGTGTECQNGSSFAYCTFYGAAAADGGGYGISWSYGAAITVNHCSFDNLKAPIRSSDGDASTTAAVTNCAFGAWYDNKYSAGITIGGTPPTATEDYNASYGPRPFIRSGDLVKVTSGGHSINYGYSDPSGTYADVFAGSTSAGQWNVAKALYKAASDGTTIGAWQFVPRGTMIVIK